MPNDAWVVSTAGLRASPPLPAPAAFPPPLVFRLFPFLLPPGDRWREDESVAMARNELQMRRRSGELLCER